MKAELRQQRFLAFERAVEMPMLGLAVLMLPLLMAPQFLDLSPALANGVELAGWFIWAAFAVELSVKTYLSPRRGRYLIEHWYDVVIVIVPFLRPLRVARSLRLLRASRGLRLLSYGVRLVRQARVVVLDHGLHYALLLSAFLFLALTAAALAFERDAAGANIRGYGDAVWWGIATITTVGYGDRYPVTTEGRMFSVFIMLLGISLFSLVTASIAAMFVRPDREKADAAEQKTEATLEDVLLRLEEMEARLIAIQAAGNSNGNGHAPEPRPVVVSEEARE